MFLILGWTVPLTDASAAEFHLVEETKFSIFFQICVSVCVVTVCGVISPPQCSHVVSRTHTSTTYLSARTTQWGVAVFQRRAAGSHNVHTHTLLHTPHVNLLYYPSGAHIISFESIFLFLVMFNLLLDVLILIFMSFVQSRDTDCKSSCFLSDMNGPSPDNGQC